MLKESVDQPTASQSKGLTQIEADPDLVLVIPCYGYASFLPEFMDGVLAQSGGVEFRCVLVDDGDPDPEMLKTAQTYAAAYPDFIHYLRPRHNGGLSGARNSGAEYALEVWPTADVIMFPDGDDRLSEDYVANSYNIFRQEEKRAKAAGQKLGWVFEHPEIFGIDGHMPRVTSHSQLWNLIGASQMPSSALSMQMFRDGLRYDENLKWAGEDWEFSVSALIAGYVAKHCNRQGFLWRRRPGSMSAAHGATMARAHNLTVIRLKNKDMFSYASIAATLRHENLHFCTISKDSVALHSAFSSIFASANASCLEIQTADLARILHTNVTMPADPCPQTFTFAPRGLPATLGNSHMHQYFALVSDFYAGQGFVVCHKFIEHTEAGSFAGLRSVSHGQPEHADSVSMDLSHIVSLLKEPNLDKVKFLTFEWEIPRESRPTDANPALDSQDVSAPLKEECATGFALSMLGELHPYGYSFAPPARFGRQQWRPNRMDWRKLPGHLLGSKGFFPAGDLKSSTLVICRAVDVADVVRWASEAGHCVDIMTLDPLDATQMDEVSQGNEVGAINQHIPAGAALFNAGPSEDFWQIDPLTPLIGLYGTALFWRTMQFARHLAIFKTSGVHRELVFKTPEDVSTVLRSISSAFKCYDTYRVLYDECGTAHSILNAFGVASEVIQIGLPKVALPPKPITT